jgi:hypothetical protein
MADELFEHASVRCEACQGRGLHDVAAGERYETCRACGGVGAFFARPPAEIHQLRQRVLDAFPNAAADPVPGFAEAPLAVSLAEEEIVNLASEQSDEAEELADDADNDAENPESREEDPWRSTSVAKIIDELDRGLAVDPEPASSGRMFVGSGAVSIRSVLIAVADDAPAAVEEAFFHEELTEIFSRVAGVNPEVVVWCSGPDSMVSGSWGLFEFRLGSRGYLYYQPDLGIGDEDESLPILGGWEPAGDPEARREFLLRVYAREWSERGLPPDMGKWATGQADILQAAVLRVLRQEPKAWHRVFDRLTDCPELSEVPASTVLDVVERTGASPRRVREVIETVGKRSRDLVTWLITDISDSEESHIVVALFLHCIDEDRIVRPRAEGDG